jgi:mannose-6-phosphate isomerase
MPEPIQPVFHEKVWGSPDIGPWFEARPGQTGEVWFQTEPPLSLLSKFIFTTERLSVQVHPNDAQAQARGLANGKTEMWHVLRADPGGALALGFRRPVEPAEARRAALDGSIVDLLDWKPVRAGETYHVPAGTVHAIGAGLAVCEIQQNSDTTYRLFDYGRPRELHLDDGLAVSILGPYIEKPLTEAAVGVWRPLVRCQYFETSLGSIGKTTEEPAPAAAYSLYLVIAGSGRFGAKPYRAGECWVARRGDEGFEIRPESATTLLRSSPLVS